MSNERKKKKTHMKITATKLMQNNDIKTFVVSLYGKIKT